MRLLKITLYMILPVMALISCREEAPIAEEGNAKMILTVMGDTSITNESVFVTLENAKVTASSEYGYIRGYTDANGVLTLEGIPSSTYNITTSLTHPAYSSILMSGSIDDIDIISGSIVYDTIYTSQISSTGIAINEIYSAGPKNDIYFFYDQFLEIYNYSDETKYLDGIIVARVGGEEEDGEGADLDNDGDMDDMTYIFKFPGSPGEENYPFEPGEFLVLAGRAINHQLSVSTAVDLSHADWEFYNQYSTSDFDNPDVPNLSNMRSDRTVDFLINLISDVVIITTGEDDNWEDGIDIDTILDGVQYKSSLTYKKTIDPRVDKGIVISPARYSGKSMQRVEPGEDTNNGTADWEILSSPTPGYQ